MEQMTPEQQKQLAIDIVENKVFGTFYLKDHEASLLGCIFMPLVLMNDEQRDEFLKETPAHLYEYYDKAGHHSINGRPIFSSFRSINKTDWKAVKKYIQEYSKQKASFLDEDKTQ